MSQVQSHALHPSANETGSGQGADFTVIGDGPAVLHIDVTLVAGTTPTLDLVLAEKDQLSGKYVNSGVTIAQIIATGIVRVAVPDTPSIIYRISWTIGGTVSPNFTFSVNFVVKDRG